jgi:hypothetical protein
MSTDAIHHECEQQKHKPATKIAELTALGQLIRVGCHFAHSVSNALSD